MRKTEKLHDKYDNDYNKAHFRIADQAKCISVTAAKCS